MELGQTDRVHALRLKVNAFVSELIVPAEPRYQAELGQDRWSEPAVLAELKDRTRQADLFDLYAALPQMTHVEMAHLSEPLGASELAPHVFNCGPQDAGNLELLTRYGDAQQQALYLQPLRDGAIRSAFAMTEPSVASSDAGNLATTARLEGDERIIQGEKSWVTGAGDPRCGMIVVLCVTNPGAELHERQSLLLVPMQTQGLSIQAMQPVFGYDDAPHGHAQLRFDEVRVPRAALIGRASEGLALIQDRMSRSRIRNCMRSIGAAERALALLIERSKSRTAFGRPLRDLGGNAGLIADCRIDIELTRMMALRAAWTLDAHGLDAALGAIAQMKVAVPARTLAVIDRAIQLHGGTGVSDDTPLARMWATHRALRLSDGPDDVHRELIARLETGAPEQAYF